jgi:hypothetical protein
MDIREHDTRFADRVFGLTGGETIIGAAPVEALGAISEANDVAAVRQNEARKAARGHRLKPDQSIKVELSFDEQSFKVLQEIRDEASLGSEAATLRRALLIMRTLQKQAKNGYSDVVVENPETGEQMVLDLNVIEPLIHDKPLRPSETSKKGRFTRPNS